MTDTLLEEDEIGVVFFVDGTMSTSRGMMSTDAYHKIKQVFIMPADTPLYRISDYWGHYMIHKTWKEIAQ